MSVRRERERESEIVVHGTNWISVDFPKEKKHFFEGKILYFGEKLYFWRGNGIFRGKILVGEDAEYRRHFLSKKNPCKEH